MALKRLHRCIQSLPRSPSRPSWNDIKRRHSAPHPYHCHLLGFQKTHHIVCTVSKHSSLMGPRLASSLILQNKWNLTWSEHSGSNSNLRSTFYMCYKSLKMPRLRSKWHTYYDTHTYIYIAILDWTDLRVPRSLANNNNNKKRTTTNKNVGGQPFYCHYGKRYLGPHHMCFVKILFLLCHYLLLLFSS